MISEQPVITLAPLVVGEKPAPLQYQYQDSAGVGIPLVGYAVRLLIWERDNPQNVTTYTGALSDGPAGKVQYTWTGTEFLSPGQWRLRFWAGNTVQRFASTLITVPVALDPAFPAAL